MIDTLPGLVVVTGAGSGIGRATALASAAAGASVAALDLDGDSARSVADEAMRLGAPTSVGLPCDVRDEDSIADAVRVAAGVAPIHGLVTCAGIDRGGLAHELTLDRWNDVLATNLTGTFLACKHVLGALVSQGTGGSIVLLSSPWATVSAPGGATAYCASKGGVSALARSLALDYASAGIRVNVIVPGATDTPLMWANLDASELPDARRRIGAQLALGRLAEPDEIAAGIVWLLSTSASYATGSELVIDGGLLAAASIEG
jgi:NAD(P)-dependent dehydrogenase (short-subunit alcohol dehydrogenase family)